MINYQLETLLSSKLYGSVILISFRNFRTELAFQSSELREKFSKEELASNSIKVEVQGPSKFEGIPGRKERLSIIQVDNLIIVNC